jgi:hypothetical protein
MRRRPLAGNLPENAAELLTPFRPVMKRFADQRHWDAVYATPRFALHDVVMAFMGEQPAPYNVDANHPAAVMVLRNRAIVAAILSGSPAKALSMPTHAGCWIDPRQLVARCTTGPTETLGLADQCLALMRLAPDHRSDALALAADISGEWGNALRYALGGSETPAKTQSLWTAATAARSFGPTEELPKYVTAGRGTVNFPPVFRVGISWDYSRSDDGWAHVRLSADRPGAGAVDFGAEMIGFSRDGEDETGPADDTTAATAIALGEPKYLRWLDPCRTTPLSRYGSWARALWPQNSQPVFALSTKASCMLDGVAGFEPATEPLAEGLIAIFDPDTPLGPMACLMLARGLNALDKSAAQATVDALIATIEDGRLDAQHFGAAMHLLLIGGIVVAKRWQPRLLDVARSSPLAALSVRHAIERALYPGEPLRPLRNMHAWLEVLLELCVEAGAAIDDGQCRQGLEQHCSGGKAKTIARKLLALEPDGQQLHRNSAAAQAVEIRIARAERWQRLTQP